MNPNHSVRAFARSPENQPKPVDIYVYTQSQRRGPYTRAQLEEMWKRGQLLGDTLYWYDGMSKWAVISDLFAKTNIVPPLLTDKRAKWMTFSPLS